MDRRHGADAQGVALAASYGHALVERGSLEENRHRVDDWVVELTAAHMATNPRDGHYTAGARRWRRRALQEYLSPGTDISGVDGLTA